MSRVRKDPPATRTTTRRQEERERRRRRPSFDFLDDEQRGRGGEEGNPNNRRSSPPAPASGGGVAASSAAAATMRTIATFLDGASRAALLPFGPSLAASLPDGGSPSPPRADAPPSSTPPIVGSAAPRAARAAGPVVDPMSRPSRPNAAARSTALLVAAHAAGRALGSSIASSRRASASFPRSRALRESFPLLVGASVAVHVFSYGAGTSSIRTLIFARFVAGALAGSLRESTRRSIPPRGRGDDDDRRSSSAPPRRNGDGPKDADDDARVVDSEGGSDDDDDVEGGPTTRRRRTTAPRRPSGRGRRRSPDDDDDAAAPLGAEETTTYLTGFAASAASGGLLRATLSESAVFAALAGARPFALSPLFFGAIVLATRTILTRRRPASPPPPPRERRERNDAPPTGGTGAETTGDGRRRGGGGTTVVRRLVGKLRRRTSADGDGEASRLPTHIAERGVDGRVGAFGDGGDDVEEEEAEFFFDPLSPSRRPENPHRAPNRRPRLDSARSDGSGDDDTFYDCASDLDADEEAPRRRDRNSPSDDGDSGEDEEEAGTAIYADRKCTYPDGSPAYVPRGESPKSVPSNYVECCGGDAKKAKDMWEATQRWRRDESVWNVHSTPHPFFLKIKAAYPHYLHGVSRGGHVVVYERPGKMDLKSLFRSGCEVDEMVRHYVFFMEYISNCVSVRPEVRALSEKAEAAAAGSGRGVVADPPSSSSSSFGTMVVMDIQGASLTHLSGDVVKYLKRAGEVGNAHYPKCMKRIFVVNTPFWVAGAWSAVKGILPDSVEADVLSSSEYLRALRDYIDDDQIPPEYGGSSPHPLGRHPFELGLRGVAERASERSDDDAAPPPDAAAATGAPPDRSSPVGGGPSPRDETAGDARGSDAAARRPFDRGGPPTRAPENAPDGGKPETARRRDGGSDRKDVPLNSGDDDESSAGLPRNDQLDEENGGASATLGRSGSSTTTEPNDASSSSAKRPQIRRRASGGDERAAFEGSSTTVLPLCRRVGQSSLGRNNDETESGRADLDAVPASDEGRILAIVSGMYTALCAVKGAIEMSLPLWMCSPPLLGGLGYGPPKTGISLFCASLVLVWLLRSKAARVASRLPDAAPMRAFRVGAAAEAVFLTLLPIVPSLVTSVPKQDSALVTASTVIALSGAAAASSLARDAAVVLHRVASASFADRRRRPPPPRRRAEREGASTFRRWCAFGDLSDDCRTGRLTVALGAAGETIGPLMAAPVFGWSTDRRRPSPFDAACGFYLASLACSALCVASFSLHLNVAGEFARHPPPA